MLVLLSLHNNQALGGWDVWNNYLLDEIKRCYRGYRNFDVVDQQNKNIKNLRDSLDSMATDFMDLIYDVHGEEGTKLDLALHRKIQDELDNADKLLGIGTAGTERHSDEHIKWCKMSDCQKVRFFKAGYIVPRI
jgi:hypothetical protein